MSVNNSSNTNQALNAYKALKKENEFPKIEIIKSLYELYDYLQKLCKTISRKTPKQNYIYQWVFTNEFDNKDAQHFYKANIFAAMYSLKRILSFIESQEITQVLRRLLIDFICDLKKYIKYFDKQQNYDWLLMNTNSHITNFYFNLAENVFYFGKPGIHEQENLALSTSTPFIIRQSIEYKMKRILGIDYIKKDGNIHKTNMNIYFKALNNNLRFYKTRNFDFTIIEKIHSWTHLYIHGGYRPKPWQIETALNYLKELFYKGETSQGNLLSYYAGIELLESDLPAMKMKTIDTINEMLEGDIEIIWQNEFELAIIKK